MTPQEWLVRWMEVKAEFADYPAYFNEEDEQDLLALSEELAMRIMLEMLEYDTDGMEDYIWAGKCPFCMLTRGFLTKHFLEMKCYDCSYGLRHGLCNRSDDDYSKFKHAFGIKHSISTPASLDNHLSLADAVISEFVNSCLGELGNSRLTSTPQLE